MYDIVQVEQNRNQHYVQSCGWFGMSYMVSWLWLSLRSWQADINLAAILHIQVFPQNEGEFFQLGAVVKLGNSFVILG